jgi:hypothetical protein
MQGLKIVRSLIGVCINRRVHRLGQASQSSRNSLVQARNPLFRWLYDASPSSPPDSCIAMPMTMGCRRHCSCPMRSMRLGRGGEDRHGRHQNSTTKTNADDGQDQQHECTRAHGMQDATHRLGPCHAPKRNERPPPRWRFPPKWRSPQQCSPRSSPPPFAQQPCHNAHFGMSRSGIASPSTAPRAMPTMAAPMRAPIMPPPAAAERTHRREQAALRRHVVEANPLRSGSTDHPGSGRSRTPFVDLRDVAEMPFGAIDQHHPEGAKPDTLPGSLRCHQWAKSRMVPRRAQTADRARPCTKRRRR